MRAARLIGRCGIVCSECPAYLATKNNDQALRVSTAKEWSVRYGVPLEPADIRCVGCIASRGAHFAHCHECEIRSCGAERRVVNCGRCPAYGCERVSKFFEFVTAARAVLDAERDA